MAVRYVFFIVYLMTKKLRVQLKEEIRHFIIDKVVSIINISPFFFANLAILNLPFEPLYYADFYENLYLPVFQIVTIFEI